MPAQWFYCFKLRSKNSSGTVQHTFYPLDTPTRVGPPTYEPVMVENELLLYDIDQFVRGYRPRLTVSFEQVEGHVHGVPSDLEVVLGDKASTATNYLEACLNENLATYPVDFTNAAWTKGNCSASNSSTTDPTGTTSSVSTVTPAGGATDAYLLQAVTPVTIADGVPYILSCYLKAASGTPSINLALRDNGGNYLGTTICALTTSWQRFSVVGVAGSGDTGLQLVIGGGASWPEADGAVLVWGAQVHEGRDLLPYSTAGDWKRVNLGQSGYAPEMPSGKRESIGLELELIGRSIQATCPAPDSGTW